MAAPFTIGVCPMALVPVPCHQAATPLHAAEAAEATAGTQEAAAEGPTSVGTALVAEGGQEAQPEEVPEELIAWLAGLEQGDLSAAVPQLRGLVWRLAASPRGTHLLQRVLIHADTNAKAALVAELEGHVNEAWESISVAPHANFVLQKCVEVMPPNQCRFICDELLRGDVQKAAQSKFGCRILQRIIEHFPCHDVDPLLVDILEEKSLQVLMVSRFGNFVVQCVLEHGSASQKTRVAYALASVEDKNFARLAENKYASHVVQHAMLHCSVDEQRLLVNKVLKVEAKEPKFKRSVYGSFVTTEARKWARLHPQE